MSEFSGHVWANALGLELVRLDLSGHFDVVYGHETLVLVFR